MTRVTARVFFKTIILSLCLLWSAQSTLATTVVRPLDDDMVVGARAIITGKVLQIESAIDQQDRIFTYITVRVNEVIKGQISQRKIILKEFGGIVGDRVSVVYGNPQFTRGEKVLLYLGTHDDGSLRTYQLFLGKFSIVTDQATGKRFAVRDTGGENVTVLTAQGQPQGDSTDRMELSAYTDLVRTKLAGNLARAQAFEETYYRNIPMLASPPNFVSSKKQVHLEYAFLGNVRWFQPDSGLAVPYTINPNPAGSGAPQVVPDQADIAAAAAAWTGVPGCSLTLSYSGNLTDCYTQTGTPGINYVANNCDGHNQPTSGCASILAIGGWSGGGYQTRVLGGITFGQITQGFVSFNPWASCYFTDHCNFREIATHETGHALGLAHPTDPNATMYAYAHFDGRCASIKTDDINGIVFLYPGSGGGPGPLAVVTSALAGGTVGTSYSQSLTGSGGTPPYSWSLVAGQGTLPTGLSLSSGGVISGTPGTAGTSNFTVTVTDAAQATAQKALSIVVTAPGAGPLASQFVSQTVPTSLQPGQTFSVNMKFLNTGTETWSGSFFYFASQNPALNQTWGGNAVSLASFVTASGQQLDVTFQATAPLTPGTYNFQWQMYKNDGTGFFGQMATNVPIQVGSAPPPAQRSGKIGLYNSGGAGFFLRNSNTTGMADVSFAFGPAGLGWIPLVGDWDGDGVDTPGLYNPATSTFFLKNSNSGGVADVSFAFGPAGAGWLPLVGDWNGDGIDTIGLFNPTTSTFFLRNSNSTGVADLSFAFGPAGAGWIPVTGDWNGDGTSTIGLYNPSASTFFLRNSNSTGVADLSFAFGPAGAGWIPVTGDWNGDGTSTIGLYNPTSGTFFLRNSNSTGVADLAFPYGPPAVGWTPVIGDWNGL